LEGWERPAGDVAMGADQVVDGEKTPSGDANEG